MSREQPKVLTIFFPSPETVAICDAYARRFGLDRGTAAERLIEYGARQWANRRRGGKARHQGTSADERRATARRAAAARWENRPAAGTAPDPEDNSPK